jgi:hypothetical protein
MKRSDEIIQQASSRGLTMSERHELREAYNHEQSEKGKVVSKVERSVKEFKDNTKDPLNMPRHRMQHKCPSFQECPIDYKCRNYSSSIIACVNCVLNDTDDICKKPELHNDKGFNLIISRERIVLDGEK